MMLELAKSEGVDFKGKRVLDVGCGSGMFTLRLAREAERVTGIDLSDRMLEISAADGQALGIKNVQYARSGWLEYEPVEPFEIVFCSMCPAAKEDEAKEKLLKTPTEALIYIGFVEYTEPKPLAALIERYNLTRRLFRSGPDMAEWLEARGEKFSRHPKRGVWTVAHAREAGRAWCRTMLGDFGVGDPDPAAIDEALAPFWDEAAQAYVLSTPYWVEMIIWRPKSSQA